MRLFVYVACAFPLNISPFPPDSVLKGEFFSYASEATNLVSFSLSFDLFTEIIYPFSFAGNDTSS